MMGLMLSGPGALLSEKEKTAFLILFTESQSGKGMAVGVKSVTTGRGNPAELEP